MSLKAKKCPERLKSRFWLMFLIQTSSHYGILITFGIQLFLNFTVLKLWH